MNKGKKLIILINILSLLFLTACWDRIELESRSFVMVVGIDRYKKEKSKVEKQYQVPESEDNRIKMTYLLPKFSAVKEAEEGKNSRQILESVGKTSYQATRNLTVRSDSQPFFQHMKAAVLGVDLVKNSDYFLEILDGLERQDEISRKVHLFVAEDQASDILRVESLLKPLSYKLQQMAESNLGTNLFIPKTLEEIITFTAQGSLLIPKITASDTEIKIAGSAIIKNNKFLNWLGESETKSVALLTGVTKQDIVQVDYKNTTIPYIIKGVKIKRNAKVVDGKINMYITLTISGNIQQYEVNKQPRFTNEKLISNLEDTVCKKISKDLNETIDKLQNDLNVDVIDIGEYLKGHEPDIWDQVKDEWEEMFSQVKINLTVDSYIDKTGSIK